MISFQTKMLQFKKFDILQLLVENSTVRNMSTPHEHGILISKEKIGCAVVGPKERKEGPKQC